MAMFGQTHCGKRHGSIPFVRGAAVIVAACSVLAGTPAVADPMGYLAGADIGYVSPPAPDNASAAGKADLAAVKKAQEALPERHTQAYEDASAYAWDQLLPRFSEAAGTSLTLHTRPVLAYVLHRVLADVGGYVTTTKNVKQNRRARPYVEDGAIIPCETDYLYPTDFQSYRPATPPMVMPRRRCFPR